MAGRSGGLRLVVRMVTTLLVAVSLPFGGTAQADPATESRVKYYLVQASYQGQPERLTEIAQRLLGTADRSGEIFDLNRGRVQPDGDKLTDPAAALHAGWALILPWDAVGAEVKLGVLPTKPPVKQVNPGPSPSQPASPPPAGGPVTATSSCSPATTRVAADIPWPQLRLAPGQAWTTTKGRGVTVAVLDSQVDSSAPGLAGRILASVPVGTGKESPAACRDHGTAVAAIIAAQPTPGRGMVGVAPEALILPVIVDTAGGTVTAAQLTAGLAAAVRAGARVAMVGAPVDGSDPAVQAAIADAVAHDVVVVVGAHVSGGPAAARPGLLRVGAVGADDSLTRQYPTGAVDVVAPGEAVITLGAGAAGEVEGSGTDFAVPFVAGLVALLRAASPDLTAQAATQHVEATADRHVAAPPAESAYGWGMINFASAFAALPATAGGVQTPAAPDTGGGIDRRLLITGGLVALLVGWFVVARLRRRDHSATI